MIQRFRFLIVAIAGLAFLASCADYQPRTSFGRSAKAWWYSPATQEGLSIATAAATKFAIHAGLAALQAYAGHEEIDLRKIAVSGGIATLYSQAASLRQLQGTAAVLDPVAAAQLMQQGGTPDEISRRLAGQLFDNATALVRSGLSPDAASEVNAAGLDQAAAILSSHQ